MTRIVVLVICGEWFFVKILFRQADPSVKVHDKVCGEVLLYDNDRGIDNIYNPASGFLSQDVYYCSPNSDNAVPVFCD